MTLDDLIKSTYELNIVPVTGQSFNGVATSIPAHLLVNHFQVDETRGNDDDGYQRPHKARRSQDLSHRILEEDVVLPMSVTVNIRSAEAFQNNVKDNKFLYDVHAHGPLWVVDGQHRIKALQMALQNAGKEGNEKKFEEIANKYLPAVITFTSDRFSEMELFTEINSHAKSVPVDQQLQNNVKRVKAGDHKLRKEMDSKGLLLANYQIPIFVEKINRDTTSLWYNRVKSPGATADSPNVGYNSMAKYIKLMFTSDALISLKLQEKPDLAMQIFNAYWDGLALVYPDMFNNPKLYSAQKAVGADCFMRVMGAVVNWITNNKNEDLKKDTTYVPAFKKMLENLGGSAENDDGSEKYAVGIEFWRSGKSGAVGNYSNEKGKAVLARMMKAKLFED